MYANTNLLIISMYVRQVLLLPRDREVKKVEITNRWIL